MTIKGFPNYLITKDGKIWSKPRGCGIHNNRKVGGLEGDDLAKMHIAQQKKKSKSSGWATINSGLYN